MISESITTSDALADEKPPPSLYRVVARCSPWEMYKTSLRIMAELIQIVVNLEVALFPWDEC